jgi:excinuclease UvrABC helicase subunit UvrB
MVMEKRFKFNSKFTPTQDQSNSIDGLLDGIGKYKQQTLKGITGSGKTFVLGNVIDRENQPAIVLAPNKVLAYQLYNELVEMFPENFVGYYVSNYDIYIPPYFNNNLNKKVEGTVVINDKNKDLRYAVKDFLDYSDKAILICSSTILFPTFEKGLPELITKHKSYIIRRLNKEMIKQVGDFKREGRFEEAERLENHIDHTINMLLPSKSEYFNTDIIAILSEKLGDFYLTDYFKKSKPNLFIDESHLTLLQLKALPSANRARLTKLVDKGFYISNVIKNNVLNFDDLKDRVNTITYMSATPSKFELDNSEYVSELITRPNNIVDPKLTIKGDGYFGGKLMIDDVKDTIQKGETVFINCISRKSVSSISDLLYLHNIDNEVIHFKIKQDKRKEILRDLRGGVINVIVGINMLREGIDVKQCSLVIVEQASRNNFLRTKSSLIQVSGRAARNVNGEVFMCCDHISSSLAGAIEEIDYRRGKQLNLIGSI